VYNNGLGIRVTSASDNNVTNNEVLSNTFNGIEISDAEANAEANYIANNNVSSNGGDGIHLESTYNNYVLGNNVTDNSQNGIVVDSSLGRDRINNNNVTLNSFNGIGLVDGGNVKVANNSISSNVRNGINISGASLSNISRNDVTSNDGNGIIISNATDNEILHNDIFSNIGSGVYVQGSSDNDIMHNNLTSNSIGASVGAGSCDNRIVFNNVSHNVLKGLAIKGKGVKSVTEDNTVFENPVGISIADMSLIGPPELTDHLVTSNTVFNNTIGIEMLTISTGFIEKVNIITNSIYRNDIGINMSGSVWDYYISKNIIDDNRIGLRSDTVILGGSYIISNTFTDNQDFAIMLLDTFGTNIYHNSFIDNGFIWQVLDDTDANSWNTLYPQGGNYWSDYSPTCQDLYDGSVTPQTSGVPDGICDDQYDIDLNSADYYPLTTEYEEWSAPPTNLSAELAGASSENVIVSWNASLEDPVNVTKYAIYYNTSYDYFGQDYRFLGEVPASGAPRYFMNVIGLGEGDPNDYFFQESDRGEAAGLGTGDSREREHL
jgi:parallel beta-helix repeat protein